MVSKFPRLALDNVRTFSVTQRKNLVTIDNMAQPDQDSPAVWNSPELSILAELIMEARRNDRPVVWSMGAHVIKNGLSRYIIRLIDLGIITHVMGNGAASIHDFELAFLGGTSEDVAQSIEDGSFGMWEETGRWMNEALHIGAQRDLGYGESLALYIQNHSDRFPFADDCVIARTIAKGQLYTCHISLGTDIIHQHPTVDFSDLAYCSGLDFKQMCLTIQKLDGGIFLNFGSAVSGPSLFLRGLALSYNLGYQVVPLAVANFDIQPEQGIRRGPHGSVMPRSRRELLNPVEMLGGQAYHFTITHEVSIPNLYTLLLKLN